MREYLDAAMKKLKKASSIDKIFAKVESIARKDNEGFVLSDSDKDSIVNLLNEGVNSYKYIKTPNDNYILATKTSFRKGTFYGDRSGNGRVSCTTSYKDRDDNTHINHEYYYVDSSRTNGAIDGDIVLVDIGGKNGDSSIIKIIDRKLESIVGEVYRMGEAYFVKPIDKKKQSLTINIGNEAIEGQRVLVNLKEKTNDNYYIGEVVSIFNHKDDPGEDVLWEAFKHGIDDQFSKESMSQVSLLPKTVRDIDRIGREDLTDWEIFTIDGSDTKDMDDAVSCNILSNGNYEIGVHIADVSHYVSDGSPLDHDAYRKGTSNYLVGKVIPMLPHELSNGICSLNPYVERCAMSCIMEVTPNGEVVNSRITPSIIKSRLKMSYEKVNDILKRGIVDPLYSDYKESLINLNRLALVLRRNRIRNGAIEFNRPELKVVLDEDGNVSGFSKRVQDVGENLIEEYMLLANETVDKFIVNHGYPCLHRIHNVPNNTRLEEYLTFLSAIGYPFKGGVSGDDIIEDRHLMQQLASHASESKIPELLTLDLIKCNSRAKYSPHNIGHYGLAKDNYCHFTSPIRRYPDLVVHRIVKDILNDKDTSNEWSLKLPEIGERTSRMEKNADEAEDDCLRMKCAEYMESHIGEEYEGFITGISDRGISIELDNMIEGFIRTRDLKGDYVYSPESFSLVSLNNNDSYFVGDRLRVKVISASKNDKRINFGVVEKIEENKTVNSTQINHDAKVKAKLDKTYRSYFKK